MQRVERSRVLGKASIAATLVACGALLAACGGKPSSSTTQVVVKVNDVEITRSQLEQALQSLAVEATPAVTQQAVDTLVNEQLLAQQALASKLDRDPVILQRLERARRQVLAQAYLERNVYPRTTVATADIEGYYHKYPVLFDKHRTYHFATFLIRQADGTDKLRAELDDAHTDAQLRAVLERNGVAYTAAEVSTPAESLPISKLDAIARANVGDLLTADQQGGQLLLMFVNGIDESHVTFEQAKPRIEEYLYNSRNQDATSAYLKVARAAAAIVYTQGVSATAPGQAQ
jgi:EpsD family peptidyl-prolyl cis-trans isomerase